MSGHDFSNREISGAKFVGTNLAGANFSNATLTEVDFSQATLNNATFENATISKVGGLFQDASLQNADLKGVVISVGVIPGADLSGVDMTGAQGEVRFREATLTGVNLTDTNFSVFGIDRCDANLIVAHRAQLGNQTSFVRIVDSTVTQGDFTDARFPLAQFENSDLSASNFSNGYFFSGHFFNTNLTDTNFTNAEMQSVTMKVSGRPSNIFLRTNFTQVFGYIPWLFDSTITDSTFFHSTASWPAFHNSSNNIFINTICPDGVNTDANGGNCDGHLTVIP